MVRAVFGCTRPPVPPPVNSKKFTDKKPLKHLYYVIAGSGQSEGGVILGQNPDFDQFFDDLTEIWQFCTHPGQQTGLYTALF